MQAQREESQSDKQQEHARFSEASERQLQDHSGAREPVAQSQRHQSARSHVQRSAQVGLSVSFVRSAHHAAEPSRAVAAPGERSSRSRRE